MSCTFRSPQPERWSHVLTMVSCSERGALPHPRSHGATRTCTRHQHQQLVKDVSVKRIQVGMPNFRYRRVLYSYPKNRQAILMPNLAPVQSNPAIHNQANVANEPWMPKSGQVLWGGAKWPVNHPAHRVRCDSLLQFARAEHCQLYPTDAARGISRYLVTQHVSIKLTSKTSDLTLTHLTHRRRKKLSKAVPFIQQPNNPRSVP